MWRNTDVGYGAISKLLHWLLFILIAGMLLSGLIAEDLSKDMERLVMGLHTATGVTVLALVALRIGWRVGNPVPALPSGGAPWENLLARLTHLGLYLLMLVQPLTGLAMVQFEGHSVNVYGLFQIPPLVAKDKPIGHFFGEMHEIGWYLLAALIALHIVAALYHHYVRKDDILRRMTTR